METLRKYRYFVILFLIELLFVRNSFAQTRSGGTIGGTGLTDPLGNKTFLELVQKIIGYLIMLGAPILVLMILYGAFLILTAREDPKKVADGKHAILWASIGYAIIICSWGIIYIIQDVLGTNSLIQ